MTAIAADIVGTVARVMDGNTFEIVSSTKDSIISIRLCGVHSPERSEPNYRPARRLLSEKIEKREIRCVRVGEGTVCDDRSKPTNKGKVIAQCFIGDDDVTTIMIRARMACDWPKFSGGHYQKVGVPDVCVQPNELQITLCKWTHEKAREPLGVSARRLVSRQCWVDWPAQPYLKPAQTI